MIAVKIARRNGVKEWRQSARSSGILSSRSRTPLPKLMQSCQSFYAICNRIFPFDDEPGALLCLRSSLFPSPPPPNPRRLPIDSTCVRLKKLLSLSISLSFPYLSYVYLYVSSHSIPPHFLSSFSFDLSLSPNPALRRKVSRDFFVPFLSPNSTAFRPRYYDFGESVFSVRNRFSRNGVIKPVVYR